MDWCCHLSLLSEYYKKTFNNNVLWPYCCEWLTSFMFLETLTSLGEKYIDKLKHCYSVKHLAIQFHAVVLLFFL